MYENWKSRNVTNIRRGRVSEAPQRSRDIILCILYFIMFVVSTNFILSEHFLVVPTEKLNKYLN